MLHWVTVPLYTKLGDSGDTMLYGGEKISKSEPRIHAYGTVDELDTLLGLILTEKCSPQLHKRLLAIQQVLYTLKADLATPFSQEEARRVTQGQVEEIEQWIDMAEKEVEPLQYFIVPGGSRSGALLHLARTMCRRAERWVVALTKEHEINFAALRYLNRLGDLFFALARVENKESGVEEIKAE